MNDVPNFQAIASSNSYAQGPKFFTRIHRNSSSLVKEMGELINNILQCIRPSCVLKFKFSGRKNVHERDRERRRDLERRNGERVNRERDRSREDRHRRKTRMDFDTTSFMVCLVFPFVFDWLVLCSVDI